jgi:ribonuclease R
MKEPTPEEAKLDEAVWRHVNRDGYQPVKPRVIAKKLGVSKDQAAEVRRSIKRLARQGRLAYGASHLVKPVTPEAVAAANEVVGVFQRHEKGFGFVRPAAPAQPATAATDAAQPEAPTAEPQDVYIPAKRSGDAATGDVVRVLLVGRSRRFPDRGPKGEIVEIIRRQTHRFVGTYFESRRTGYVRIDGSDFPEPVLVGDPGAKNARPHDKVVIEMVRFPSAAREGEAVIVEVLGPAGRPGVDTLLIMRQFGLPDEFPQDVLDQAHRAAAAFDEQTIAGRVDMTDRTIVTIDPADARDFDDAISLERLDNGHWVLGVHIADVAHFVPAGTPLDDEARRRATSVYLPDRVIPMLPESISNSVASLQPDRVRLTNTVLVEFTPEGRFVGAGFHSSAIRSTRRLNYDEVDRFLADPAARLAELGPEVDQLLGRMHELAMILRQRRFERGALELVMPDVKIELDASGRVVGARVIENTASHQIIEEFMLAANEAVARRLAEAHAGFLRRIHASPNPRKLKELAEFVQHLGFKTHGLDSRQELQRLLDEAATRPQRHAVHYAVLRSMQRAVYGPQEEGHYALASSCYCHFTSPIRRYPDLTVHRRLAQVLEGAAASDDYAELVALGQHCSDREQMAEAAERELVQLKLLGYLNERIGEEMDAVITGVERFGLFVEGLELPARGLIRLDALGDDHYHFDRARHTLSGHRSGDTFRLGDLVRVAVACVDMERRELDFRLVRQPRGKTNPRRAR